MTPSSRVLGRMYSTGSSSSSARLQKSMSHSSLACIRMTSLPKDDVNSQTDVSCIGYVLPFGKALSQSILMVAPIIHSQKKKVKTFARAFFHYGSRRYEQWQLRCDSPFMRSNMLAGCLHQCLSAALGLLLKPVLCCSSKGKRLDDPVKGETLVS